METNNIDKIVRDSLKSRTIKPSNSSWERLSNQLDFAQEKKRKNWFLYAGYAASILLVVSVAFFMNTDDVVKPITPNVIVASPIIDTTKFVKPTIENTIKTETVIVKTDEVEGKLQPKKSIVTKRKTQIKQAKIIEENPIVIADNKIDVKKQKRIIIDSNSLLKYVDQTETKVTETTITIPTETKKFLQKSTIKINSDALLYAVTNPDKDINEYYKKHNIDRNDVLKNIQKELNKTNLKIDAATLLTSVEKTIDEETFKKSFMQVVKGKITGLAEAIANRNN
ncbi:hypothetical protein KCTC32516_02137 [Polaribacter huanghezhanensis]|uniref:hypothetical protein n=1 Tax=Polaribacter huanghezhanensis TaxID=1354726 RepID=UPI002649A4E3|nr:hypothetical protein [Polaribacter huanghezhanensis]WKD86759.1 hypothetical protein KCTC32516_02137 [Polaribacter huanghezhanensis]